MTGDQPEGRAGSAPGDDAVPHPFGRGRLGERKDAPEEPVASVDDAAVSQVPEPAVEPPKDVEPAEDVEPEVSAEPVALDEQGEPEEAAEPPTPEEPAEPEGPAEPGESAEPEDGAAPEEPVAPVESPPEAVDRPKVRVTARRRRDPLAAALIGVLTLLLGFAFAVQVRNVGNDQLLAGAREEDLVRILDDLNAREERLREQIGDQRTALGQLTSSDSQSATALEEARKRAEAIGILNGTLAAQGPGLSMTVRDPNDTVRVADVLDAIQELRGAGAETMQIDGVRVGVSTAVTGNPGSLMIDGRPITEPYAILVIGSPQNMETALNIPGGVVPRFTSRGASVDITQSDQVVVDALRPLDTPQYAAPDTGN